MKSVFRRLASSSARSTTTHRENSRFVGSNPRIGHYNYVPPKIANFELFAGDLVQVRSNSQTGAGRPLPDQGKQARIKFVDRQKGLLFLPELNVQEETVHVASAYKQPSTVIRAQPYQYQDVELVNPSTGVPCREGYEWRRLTVDNYARAVRVDLELGTVIPVPQVVNVAMKERRPALAATSVVEARKVTYKKHPLFAKHHTATAQDEKKRNAQLVDMRQNALRKLDGQRERFLREASATLAQLYNKTNPIAEAEEKK